MKEVKEREKTNYEALSIIRDPRIFNTSRTLRFLLSEKFRFVVSSNYPVHVERQIMRVFRAGPRVIVSRDARYMLVTSQS